MACLASRQWARRDFFLSTTWPACFGCGWASSILVCVLLPVFYHENSYFIWELWPSFWMWTNIICLNSVQLALSSWLTWFAVLLLLISLPGWWCIYHFICYWLTSAAWRGEPWCRDISACHAELCLECTADTQAFSLWQSGSLARDWRKLCQPTICLFLWGAILSIGLKSRSSEFSTCVSATHNKKGIKSEQWNIVFLHVCICVSLAKGDVAANICEYFVKKSSP